jgi:hypothetical protein
VVTLINKIYKEKLVLGKLKHAYKINTPQGLQITSFLKNSDYIDLLKYVKNSKFNKMEIRDMYSFFEANCGALQIFKSKEFISFVSALIGKRFRGAEYSLRMFMHRSYTLINDKSTSQTPEFYFDLTPGWNDAWGGYIAYITDEGNKVITPNHPNSIIIAEGSKSYVKYVNCLSHSKGRLMIYGRLK